MSEFVAALPMYDWPEVREDVDAEWAALRDRLRAAGIDAPERLARRNADLPPVPGGIRDGSGNVIAPDPATLPPDDFDLFTLWRHPRLLLSQTCWGPLVTGLEPHVMILHQPDYSTIPGGEGEHYSSAILMRREAAGEVAGPPLDGRALIPLDRVRGLRFAFNNPDSMSGLLGIERDLRAQGLELDIFAERIETGGHRGSIVAVAEGRADVCAVDCRSWVLAQRHEPRSAELEVVGWTARRNGLPYIAAARLETETLALLRQVHGTVYAASRASSG